MTKIDHLVWAAPDLDKATSLLEAQTGVQPQAGGSHPGEGTRNAVLGLGPRTYLEVLAPDPAQARPTGRAQDLTRLKAPRLHTFAVAAGRLDRVAAKLEQGGLPHAGVIPMSRRLPSGRLVRWRLLIPAGHAYGPFVPFFIDWADAPHPSEGAGEACQLESLRLIHPEAWSLRPLLERLEVDVEVVAGPAEMRAELSTPKGPWRLSSLDATLCNQA